MKKLQSLLGLSFLFLFSACSSSYIGLYETSSENVFQEGNDFKFENDSIAIYYDFWQDHGKFQFTILNKTDRPIYIDWTKSNFIRNGKSYDYFTNTRGHNTSGVISENDSNYNLDIETSGVSYSLERPFTQIPPKAMIDVQKFHFDYEIDLDAKLYGKVETKEFSKEDSELYIRNYLSYTFDSELKDLVVLENEFWVSKTYRMKAETFEKKYAKFAQNNKRMFFSIETVAGGGSVLAGILAIGGAVIYAVENDNE